MFASPGAHQGEGEAQERQVQEEQVAAEKGIWSPILVASFVLQEATQFMLIHAACRSKSIESHIIPPPAAAAHGR